MTRTLGGLLLLCGLLLQGASAAQTFIGSEPLRAAIREHLSTRPPAANAALGSLDEGVAALYAAREFQPLWVDPERRAKLITALQSLDGDGLLPADYLPPDLPEGEPDNPAVASLAADIDVASTRRVLLALRHLQRGKVDPGTLDADWNFTRPAFDPSAAAEALKQAVEADDYDALLDAARPHHWLYGRLRLALNNLRQIEAAGGWPLLPEGKALEPGEVADAVPLLRARLLPQASTLMETRAEPEATIGAEENPTAAADPRLYDAALEAAVRQYQSAQYLEPDGVVGRGTRAALNVSVRARIAQLRVNLERARWMLQQDHARFVLVDIAGFRASYFRDGERVWTGRVQVGRPYRRTPSFEAEIRYITFNPTWTVPPTILREDILPKLPKEPGYLAKHHMQVLDLQGQPLPRAGLERRPIGSYLLRQDAGVENPLGSVVIRFPNPYAVYMHDTPSQALFGKAQRAFSSGCIRVERARELVELLFDDATNWNRPAIDAFIAQGQTRDVNLPAPVPLLIAYWTVDVGPEGQVGFRNDLYERDPAVLQALDAPVSGTP